MPRVPFPVKKTARSIWTVCRLRYSLYGVHARNLFRLASPFKAFTTQNHVGHTSRLEHTHHVACQVARHLMWRLCFRHLELFFFLAVLHGSFVEVNGESHRAFDHEGAVCRQESCMSVANNSVGFPEQIFVTSSQCK